MRFISSSCVVVYLTRAAMFAFRLYKAKATRKCHWLGLLLNAKAFAANVATAATVRDAIIFIWIFFHCCF